MTDFSAIPVSPHEAAAFTDLASLPNGHATRGPSYRRSAKRWPATTRARLVPPSPSGRARFISTQDVAVAYGIAACLSTACEPSDEWEGCVE